jgi:hypothetical protein
MILPFTPESFREIRRSSITTRLFYILTPSLGITAIFYKYLMVRFVDSIYGNFVAGFIEFSSAPQSFHTTYDLIFCVIIFIICVLFWSIWFASTRIEEVMDL